MGFFATKPGLRQELADRLMRSAIKAYSKTAERGQQPNCFEVVVPRRLCVETGLKPAMSVFGNSLKALISNGVASPRSVLMVDTGTLPTSKLARSYVPTITIRASYRYTPELNKMLESEAGRIGAGLKAVTLIPRESLYIVPAQGNASSPLEVSSAFYVGTARDNELSLDVFGLSSYHCELCPTSDGWSLVDLSSTNGTERNGTRISAPTPIRLGDTVSVAGRPLFSVSAVKPWIDICPSGRTTHAKPNARVGKHFAKSGPDDTKVLRRDNRASQAPTKPLRPNDRALQLQLVSRKDNTIARNER